MLGLSGRMNIHQCYIWIAAVEMGLERRTSWWKGASGGTYSTSRHIPHARVYGVLCFRNLTQTNFDVICALLRYYAAFCGNSLPTFRDNLSAPSSSLCWFLTLEAGIDRFSRNVGGITTIHCLISQKRRSTLPPKPAIMRNFFAFPMPLSILYYSCYHYYCSYYYYY